MNKDDSFDLSGQVALVTGASRGIGAEIAKRLALHGAEVIVSSRKPDACAVVVDEIRSGGGKADAMACHVGAMKSIESVLTDVDKRFGRLDILVNNAATSPYYGSILETDEASFDKSVEVNIKGYFFMSKKAAAIMRRRNSGSIINIASIGALQPGVGQGIYCITKAAVVNMTRAFAAECASFGVRVNALLPGLTETKFAGAMFRNDEFYEKFISRVPLGRHAAPEEMAGAALFLASGAGSYVTGASLVVDGGVTACGL